LPAVAPLDSIVQTAEKFFDACTNYRSGISYRRVTKVDPTDKDGREEYEENIRPYELIAAEWPHYVLPPNHPFTFLCPGMPCRFFQAV
jgi:hypothetical protein